MIELSVPITVDKDKIGTALIAMSEHKIRAQIIKTVAFILIVNLATALLLGLALFIASRKIIVNPITNLTAISRLVASGDLTRTVDTVSDDEIGELSRATNKMIGDLKSLIGGIRETASKTMAVSEKIVMGADRVKQGAGEHLSGG